MILVVWVQVNKQQKRNAGGWDILEPSQAKRESLVLCDRPLQRESPRETLVEWSHIENTKLRREEEFSRGLSPLNTKWALSLSVFASRALPYSLQERNHVVVAVAFP